MNPTITISDILAMAPEFVELNQGCTPTQLETQVPLYNSMADSVVASPPYPSTPLNPDSGMTEIQALLSEGVPATGSLILTFKGQPTAAILPTDGPSDIEAKITALSTIGAGNATVSGDWTGTAGPPTITFATALANTNQPLLVVLVDSFMTGGSKPIPVHVFPKETQRGFAPVTAIYAVKMLVICHWLKCSKNTEGPITMDKVGDLQSQYATPDLNQNQDWNETIYGRRYLQMRRIYAFSLGVAPQPRPAPYNNSEFA